ncbi:hypothetical protein, partial [Pantoea piersonii]
PMMPPGSVERGSSGVLSSLRASMGVTFCIEILLTRRRQINLDLPLVCSGFDDIAVTQQI